MPRYQLHHSVCYFQVICFGVGSCVCLSLIVMEGEEHHDVGGFPEPELMKEKDHRRSDVWKDFLTISEEDSKDGKKRALCIHCKNSSFIASSRYGTTNLRRHLEKCAAYQQNPRAEVVAFNQKDYRDLLARAIIKHGYAFSWVEHDGNRKIHAYLNNQVRSICRNTAKSDVLKLHASLKVELKESLSNVPGRICLTSDMWTSCQTEGYMCLTAHYVDVNWKLQSRVLNFCHIETPHTGQMMHNYVLALLQEWGIEDKIFTITLDNASSNDRMQDRLKNSLNDQKALVHDGLYFHVRCAAHVLNLIVKDGLKVIENTIVKIRESVKYVKWSESRKKTFRDCVKLARIESSLALWLDVPTRWNSTYLMIHRGILYRNAFQEMVVADPMYKWFPEECEWDILIEICDILEPFYDVTQLFSGSEYPTSNLYFENVWKINMLLEQLMENENDMLRKMGNEMIEKFDKYWASSVDDSYATLFAFSMILDPRCKLDFLQYCYSELFDNVQRAALKASDVRNKLGTLLLAYKSSDERATRHISTETSNRNAVNAGRKRKYNFSADFDDVASAYNFNGKTKLDQYLDDARMSRDDKTLDVLKFWKDNESRYGELSHLARDILSVPLTTVASESTFSIGGRVLNKWRSSYLPENVEALITTRSWLFGFEESEEDDFVGCDVGWVA